MGNIEEHVLHRFFHPDSIALIGASENPFRPSYNLVSNLIKLGYRGRIYPVNPTRREILGIKTYPAVDQIDGAVDLAVIAVSKAQTPDLLQECIRKGIRRIVLVAGGFSEIGPDGRRLQTEIAERIQASGVRAIGPNALSPINPRIGLAVSFHALDRVHPGGLSLIFQSGLYEPRLRWLSQEANLHLNKLIDLGNKMDLNEVDALSYLVHDPLTHVIGLHLESIEGDGRQFLDLIGEAASMGKPVVVLKSGRTEAGAKAAASHTGALVRGNDRVFDRILKQFGAIRADSIDEFFDLCRALERFDGLAPTGNRIVIATMPGGEAVVMTDRAGQSGWSMARVTDKTLERMRLVFPPWEMPANPFDLGVTMQFGHPVTVFNTLVEALASDPGVDAAHIQIPELLLMLPRETFDLFRRLPEAGKPLALWVAGLEPGDHEILAWLEEHRIPVFSSPDKALEALTALRRIHARQNRRRNGRPS